MKVISFNLDYEVIEFNYFITEIEDKPITVLELLINCKIDDFYEEDFNSIFVFKTADLTYVFSGFKVEEFYEEGQYLHVTCVK